MGSEPIFTGFTPFLPLFPCAASVTSYHFSSIVPPCGAELMGLDTITNGLKPFFHSPVWLYCGRPLAKRPLCVRPFISAIRPKTCVRVHLLMEQANSKAAGSRKTAWICFTSHTWGCRRFPGIYAWLERKVVELYQLRSRTLIKVRPKHSLDRTASSRRLS